jgi:hypothetical protein
MLIFKNYLPNQKTMIMRKLLLLTFLSATIAGIVQAQTGNHWTVNNDNRAAIPKDKAVSRLSYPKEYKLFNLQIAPLRQELFSIVDRQAKRSTIITLPNAAGNFEQFEVFESSNFEPELQARFPEIRAYSGRGITDRTATLKLSISSQGIQTMVFRSEKENEFIEAFSADHRVYSVFRSQRPAGGLKWNCSTPDEQLATGLNNQVNSYVARSGGNLKTLRLAQSCNAEYSNWFGAFNSSQVGLVLAAFNATLTRCNGVYEKDLALHLNLVASSTNVIYYNPSTDPYTTLSNWNSQLQHALNTTLTGPGTTLAANNAAYDIGHMFGASGGGGNAGCIGCVCVDGISGGGGSTKGRGITSPADNIPQGDNFDIDYVVHEVGHQLGANHTFSMSNEGTGVNKEVGSGITIMGYAGITDQDVAPHSIDIFHQASIAQIQANLNIKTCPVTTTIVNATPAVNAGSDYTIPISTPFALTGSATDADAGDVLTYCWEQNDNALSSQTNASSVASATKASGPNWISFKGTTTPTRLFPKLSTILAGQNISGPLPGGDAGANTEALSSVSRTLNFRLTVSDNALYSSTAPVSVGQTQFDDVVITVTNTAGPFAVTAPNSAVTITPGSNYNVTWSVNGTNTGTVNCANVNILLSSDGGQTFPVVLAANTANDGSETVAMPNTPGSTYRVKVESVGNIFFDISNANFTLGTAPTCPGQYDVEPNNNTTQAQNIPLNTDVTGTIGVRNDNDYYRFVIGTGGTITLSLTTMPANYQLALLNSAGAQLAISQNSGTANETINQNVTAGTYYARVFPKGNVSNASSCYTLRVQTGTASRSAGNEYITSATGRNVNGSRLSLFPNPAGTVVNLTLEGISEKAEIKVYSMTGTLMMRQLSNKLTAQLNVSALPAGVYMVTASDGVITRHTKFVKE